MPQHNQNTFASAQSRLDYRVGATSWTERTLLDSGTFYPSTLRTAEERLRFYAEQFNTVEVDSSYYAMPSERNSHLWVERTPADFIFNIKAFSMLTQHDADVSRLPIVMKEMLTEKERSERRLKHPPREVLDLAFQMFGSAIKPLGDADKLGFAVFQFPPYFVCNSRNFDYMAALQERLPEIPLAIEFRHPSWVVPDTRRSDTMRFLREHGLFYVSVDEPQSPSTLPTFIDATGDQLYIRFHGRNREAWFKRSEQVADRYKYLYAERELAEWAERIRSVGNVKRAYVMFNNCYRNFGVMNATTMKQMLSH